MRLSLTSYFAPLTVISIIALASCGKSDSAATPSPSATPDADPSATPTPVTGSLAVLPPDQLLATTQTSLASIANVKATDGQSSLYPGALAIATGLTTADPDPSLVCKASGTPKDSQETLQGEDLAKYVAKVAYCDLAMRPDGPDTTRGGIDRLQGFLCAVRDHLTYDSTKKSITFKFSTSCFSETFVNMVKSDIGTDETPGEVTSYSAVAADKGNPAYSKLIEINLTSVGLAYTIQLQQTDTVLAAAAVLKRPINDKLGDAIAIRLETGANGSIRYEGRFAAGFGDDSGPGMRHLRVYAAGNADATTGAFTTVNNLQYLFQDTYSNNASKVQTVTGSPTAGYRATYQWGTNFTNWETYDAAPANHCYGGGTCAGNNGLKIAKAEDEKFARTLTAGDASAKDAIAWFKARGPLAFETVTFAGEQE